MTEDIVTQQAVRDTETVRRQPLALVRLAAPVVRWVLVAVFVGAGGAKLAGLFSTPTLFAMVGVGQWFRYAVGSYELIGAALLGYHKTTRIGVIALVLLMLGAAGTEMFILTRPPLSSGATLVGLLVVFVGCRRHLDPPRRPK